MRPDRIVVVAPEGQLTPSVIQAVEDLLVQKFVPEAAVEAFDEGILLGLARVDLVPRHAILVGPFQDGPTGELGSIVADNTAGFAVDPDKGAEFTGNPSAGQAGIGNQAQAFPGAVVDQRQNPKLPRGAEAVRYEV